MARPLRYEAPGAVYHVMARGDGGRIVFESESDREDWLRRLGEVCGKYGWRVHAWVLMGNHFHILLETPEANLVAGMKWFMGVFSQGWNRRRGRRGHVFQGRYKAVIVDGAAGGINFRIVADYVHLNPVRAGLVGGAGGKRLVEWEWSSFPSYAGRRKCPEWLVSARVVAAFELAEGRRGRRSYCRYLEERAKDRKAAMNDEALDELRKGWYLGGEKFRDRILDSMAKGLRAKRRRGSVSGPGARAHDEAEAARIVKAAGRELGLPARLDRMRDRGCYRDERALVAWLVRKRTGATTRWVAERLAMGHPTAVSRAVGRVGREGKLAKRGRELERAVVAGFTD
jgi:putative transposase